MSLIDGETIINSIMVYIILYLNFRVVYVFNTIACESSSIIISINNSLMVQQRAVSNHSY